MLVIDFENKTMEIDYTEQSPIKDENVEMMPISDTERIEALEAAILELAGVIFNG